MTSVIQENRPGKTKRIQGCFLALKPKSLRTEKERSLIGSNGDIAIQNVISGRENILPKIVRKYVWHMHIHALFSTTHITTYVFNVQFGRKKTNTKGYSGSQGNCFTGANKLGKIGKSSDMVGLQPCPECQQWGHSPAVPWVTEASASATSALLHHAQGVQERGITKERAGPRTSCSSCSQLLDTPLGFRDSWHRLGSQHFSINKETCKG